MKRWLVLILLFLVPPSLAMAEPFLSTQGPVMERNDILNVIVINEWHLFVEPATSITDDEGRTLGFHHLEPGRWVSVEAEPDDRSRMIAERIILMSHE
jgi:hypothetical protein